MYTSSRKHVLLTTCIICLCRSVHAADKEKAKPRMNFVFMFPDTIRAESLSGYGNPLPVSPNLDEFAKTSVRFNQAHAMHTQCTPSRVTMLTGRHMHVLGHRTQTHLIESYEFNYFRTLKESGYHIQYYGKNDVFSPDTFNLSVSKWAPLFGVEHGPPVVEYPDAGYYSMLRQGGQSRKDDAEQNWDYKAVLTANAWMKNSPPQPFLLFIPGIGAHPPYGAPREFNEKWSVDDVKKNIKLRPPYGVGKPSYHSREKGIPHYRNLTSLDSDFFYKIHATYLGMLSYTDWIFGELLKGIKEAGLEDNTAIFFSSDHGDFGGDFNMVEKWPGGADDILSRVPLYARIPDASKQAAGFVSQAPVSLMDVPHTMCELAGIDVSGHKYGVNFGTSLVPQLRYGREGNLSRFVYAEGGFGFPNEVFPGGSDHVPDDPTNLYYPRAQEEMSDNGNGSPKWVMRRNLTHKIVYRPRGISELYDFRTDPRELTNLWDSPQHAGVQAEMLNGLLRWLVEEGDVSPIQENPRGVPKYPYAASACATSGVDGPNTVLTQANEQVDALYFV
eukprot:TRINITY_DN63240_c0_g1_i1.p1 TRINITY_DN63240_c0_g1~~TRINITY_DN63240_c0_g1_i1.p1  ORF type:complete len:557 (+),score=53.19 TRINITY_DN63240_c0_g1_i1:130-1800(+)